MKRKQEEKEEEEGGQRGREGRRGGKGIGGRGGEVQAKKSEMWVGDFKMTWAVLPQLRCEHECLQIISRHDF